LHKGEEIDGGGHCRAGEGEMGWRRGMTGGAGLSAAVGVGWVTIRAGALLGHGLLRQLGRIGSLQPFSIFLISFFLFFSFSVFLFLPYNLQKCFKSFQTTFRYIVKFKVVI
jgi:hypothetical protein